MLSILLNIMLTAYIVAGHESDFYNIPELANHSRFLHSLMSVHVGTSTQGIFSITNYEILN